MPGDASPQASFAFSISHGHFDQGAAGFFSFPQHLPLLYAETTPLPQQDAASPPVLLADLPLEVLEAICGTLGLKDRCACLRIQPPACRVQVRKARARTEHKPRRSSP